MLRWLKARRTRDKTACPHPPTRASNFLKHDGAHDHFGLKG